MTGNHMINIRHVVVDAVDCSKFLGDLSLSICTLHKVKSANRKRRGLFLLKQAGVISDSVVARYKAQVQPAITLGLSGTLHDSKPTEQH